MPPRRPKRLPPWSIRYAIPRDSIRFPAEGWLRDRKRPSTTRRAAKTTCRNPRSCAPRRSDARCHTSAPTTRGHPEEGRTRITRRPPRQPSTPRRERHRTAGLHARPNRARLSCARRTGGGRRPQATQPPRKAPPTKQSIARRERNTRPPRWNTPRSKRGVRRTAQPIPSYQGLSKRKSPAHTTPRCQLERPSKNQPTCELPATPSQTDRKTVSVKRYLQG